MCRRSHEMKWCASCGITSWCWCAADTCRDAAAAAAVGAANGPTRADGGDADDADDERLGERANRKRQQPQPQPLPSAVGGSSRKRTPTSNPDTNHQSSNPDCCCRRDED